MVIFKVPALRLKAVVKFFRKCDSELTGMQPITKVAREKSKFICIIRYHEKKHAVYLKMLSDQRTYTDLMKQ